MLIRALVADDDPLLRELVCDILRKEGLHPVEARDGQQALDIFFGSDNIDILILDVMMPVHDGWEVLKTIREYSDVPIVMLTALGDEKHEVLGLRRGADEYIAKPFSYEVFVARVNTHVRKLKKERLAELRAGELVVSQSTRKVTMSETEVELSRKEYDLLVYLMTNRDRILTRDQMLSRLWGYDFEGDTRTIDTHIKTLRAKLSYCGCYIKTVRGVGYKFEADQE